MYRTITYDSADAYCRYLDIGLQTDNSTNICGGRFGSFLKDRLGIDTLPYGLKLGYLMCDSAFIPELLVKLPDEYFINWTNFPQRSARFDHEPSEQENAAGYCDLYILHTGNFSSKDLLHPYDKAPLNQKFRKTFSVRVPEFFEYKSHPNNRKFIPYEGYFAYWKGYVLVEALGGYENIDKFLSREVGIQTFCTRLSQITNDWNSKYKKIFERLSFYRTAQAMLNSSHAKADLTYGKIASFLIGKTKSKPGDLELDLEMLLILFKNWQRKIEDNGKGIYVKPLEILRQDIYFLFEWICCLTDNGEKYYFDKWCYENRCANQWAQLKDVISYEEFELQDEFEKSVPFYAKEVISYGYLKDVNLAYEKLSIHDSFWPWIRSFADMHKSINRKSVVSFRQPRILDYLIVMTIRTEILIRSIYVHHVKLEEPNDLRDIFLNMSKLLNDQQAKKIFGIVVNKWSLTRLSEKPESIFQQIEDISVVKGLSNKNHHIIKQLLKFVASRNYFAHHSYKDDSINSSVSKTSAEVLTSTISSLIYFKDVAEKGINTA